MVVSAYGDMEKIRTAMNRGAFDFIIKPINFDDFQITLDKAIHQLSLVREAQKADLLLQDALISRKQAEERERVKQTFLANMSHEIRTPINAISGMAKLMLKREHDEQDNIYLNAIHQSSENLVVIVNDILDFSKIEAGKMEFEEIPFSPVESLQLTFNTLRFKAEEKGLKLITNCADNIPQFVLGDPVRLNQILINLTGNAIKFTEAGSVSIHASVKEKKDNVFYIQFDVIDTGIGIPEDKLEKVFDSFSQASYDTARKFGGTGLGLTISKQFVEGQNGKISISSTVGSGTTFSFYIPYKESVLENKTAEDGNITDEILNMLRTKNILLADDNLFNRMVAEGLITTVVEGINIVQAESGKDVLAKMEEQKFDLILMDVQMPEMSGLEATTLIREHKIYSNMPIIAMSAGVMKEEVQACFNAGMNDFVTKPFNPDDLILKMAKLIGN